MEGMQIILISAFVSIIIAVLVIMIKSLAAPRRVDTIRKLVKQGKNQAAAKLAKQIIAKEPKNYAAHYYLGKAYLADNRGELALMEFKVIGENALFGPALPEIPFRREFAALQQKFNQPAEALREYLILTKIDSSNPDNFFYAGQIYDNQGRRDLALGFYKRCVMLDKKNAKAHGALGYILYQAKQYTEAKKELDTAIALSPETYSSYYYLGKLLKEAKDYGGAVKAFDKAQRDNEFKQKALIERSTCYMMANRYDNAQIDLQRAIELDKDGSKSDTLYARYFLAACYEKNRKIEKAIEQWELIHKKNRSFRDVAAKLNEYKDLQANDSLKDYLTCGENEFLEICKNMALKVMGLSAQQAESKKYGCQLIATEAKEGDWRNMRKHLTLMRFYREPDPVEDASIREALDTAKAANCTKAFAFSCSGFTSTAAGFAENRPIELVSKDKLEDLLSKASR